MALYNSLFGVHPAAKYLLKILDLDIEKLGRFRDIYIEEKADDHRIILFTRLGGGNRSDYTHVYELLRKHPDYIRDYDDDFDMTYSYIEFKIPENYKNEVLEIYKLFPEKRGVFLFKKINGKIEKGIKDEETENFYKVGEKIFNQMKNGNGIIELYKSMIIERNLICLLFSIL